MLAFDLAYDEGTRKPGVAVSGTLEIPAADARVQRRRQQFAAQNTDWQPCDKTAAQTIAYLQST